MVSFFGSSITIFNYLQIRKQSGVSDFQYTDSETGTEAIQGLSRQDEIHETMYHEAPGRLVPIATLDTLPSLKESKTLVNNRIFQKNFSLLCFIVPRNNRTKIKCKLLFLLLIFISLMFYQM